DCGAGGPMSAAAPAVTVRHTGPPALVAWLATSDHKRIGVLYMVTAFGFSLLAGLMAMVMRSELAQPGQQIVSAQTYDQLFTIHGTLMMLFFATPLAIGFANYIVPLQIGAADMAFP